MEVSELNELTHGRTIEELEDLIAFQLRQGEKPGGAIISHIQQKLDQLKAIYTKIIEYWHISRTALAGMPTVPTKHDRLTYIHKTIKQYDAELIKNFSPKRLWNEILDATRQG